MANLLLDYHQGPFASGAFVRVRAGLRVPMRDFPEATKLLAQHLSHEFPGDSFLTLQLQRNRDLGPHKDTKNSALPTLLCNLSPDAPGGTWVEDPTGDVTMACPDGSHRRGKILTGPRYRLSARRLWHATIPDDRDRILLLGWVPAGWRNLSPEDLAGLASLGFTAPAPNQEARGTSSVWRGNSELQKGLEDFGFSKLRAAPRRWPSGTLNSKAQCVHICLSSDDEEGLIIDLDGDSDYL